MSQYPLKTSLKVINVNPIQILLLLFLLTLIGIQSIGCSSDEDIQALLNRKTFPILDHKYEIEYINHNQDSRVSQPVKEPFIIRVKDQEGQPVPDLQFIITHSSDYEGAFLSDYPITPEDKAADFSNILQLYTNANGELTFYFKNGSSQKLYHIQAFLKDPQTKEMIILPELQSMALDIQGILFFVIGGLALFLFGMKLMNEGLQTVAADRMKQILNRLTKNAVAGIVLGFFITAVIQSSSATTVMVVGLVNAGLLQLAQSIGVIMGANIGTTVTGFILSFKLSHYALVIAAIGFIMMMVGRQRNLGFWGNVVLGFALLFIGMDFMSTMLKPLKDSPGMMSFMSTFSQDPILGVLAGTLVVLVIQSSSAAMGITLVLVGAGLIDLQAAFSLILGENIGTTITAQIAALTSNRTSKQAAMVHTLFNTFGTALMLVLFYTGIVIFYFQGLAFFIDLFTEHNLAFDVKDKILINTHLSALSGQQVAASEGEMKVFVAASHFAFNFGNTLIFLPMVGLLRRAAEYIVPIKEDAIKTTILDPRLIDNPYIALSQGTKELAKMLLISREMLKTAIDAFITVDDKSNKDLQEKEEMVDMLQSELTSYMVDLAQRALTDDEASRIPPILHANNDIERISDLSLGFFKNIKKMKKQKVNLAKVDFSQMLAMYALVDEMMDFILKYIDKENTELIEVSREKKKKIDDFKKSLQNDYQKLARKTKGKEVLIHIALIDVINNLEKMGEYLINVGDSLLEIR